MQTGQNGGAPRSVLDTALEVLETLSKSERRVAEEIISNPHRFAESSMATAARQSGVSEPTIRRVAHSLGFSGFKALQRALTQELAVGLPAALSEIDPNDEAAGVLVKVFDRILSSLSHLRAELDPTVLEKAVLALIEAKAVVCVGFGGARIVAEDAAIKLAILGVPVIVPTDTHALYSTIAQSAEGTLVFAFSNSGETRDTVRIVELAASRGFTIIALTGEAESNVANLATISIAAETPENTDLYAPSASRIAALAVIDTIAGMLAIGLSPEHWDRYTQMKVGLLGFKTS